MAVKEPVAVAPRQMTREDRRVIFEKLNEVYLDGERGYSGDWSDQKVAVDLGVPVAWVTAFRKENLGDSASNEAAQASLGDARKLLAEIDAALKQFAAARELFAQELTAATKRLA